MTHSSNKCERLIYVKWFCFAWCMMQFPHCLRLMNPSVAADVPTLQVGFIGFCDYHRLRDTKQLKYAPPPPHLLRYVCSRLSTSWLKIKIHHSKNRTLPQAPGRRPDVLRWYHESFISSWVGFFFLKWIKVLSDQGSLALCPVLYTSYFHFNFISTRKT